MNNLTVIANEMVPVYKTENSSRMVNARELHSGLKSRQRYADWIKDRIEKYGFEEQNDFFVSLGKSTGGRPKTEYFFTVDSAKEICMLERNEQGRRVRKYFIEVENKAREVFDAPKTYVEALEAALSLAKQIEEQKPLVLFAEKCLKSEDSILIGTLAKLACDNGCEIGRDRLFKKLREWGLLNKYNVPYQHYMKYFEVIERPISTYNGVKLSFTTKVKPEGQAYILNRLAQ